MTLALTFSVSSSLMISWQIQGEGSGEFEDPNQNCQLVFFSTFLVHVPKLLQ